MPEIRPLSEFAPETIKIVSIIKSVYSGNRTEDELEERSHRARSSIQAAFGSAGMGRDRARINGQMWHVVYCTTCMRTWHTGDENAADTIDAAHICD